jgi:hypothetical protein
MKMTTTRIREISEDNPPEVIKLIALIKLRKAILEERYEECSEFIALARKWGAKSSEIKNLLKNPVEGFEGD